MNVLEVLVTTPLVVTFEACFDNKFSSSRVPLKTVYLKQLSNVPNNCLV